MSRAVITLTTDFGASSSYVAQMKGAILTLQGDVELVDLTHAIPPQQILAAAVTLVDSYHYFPAASIHVAVVDPGVGTDRAIVAAEIDGHFFVAPDNGVLGLVAARVEPARVVRVENAEFWNQPVSPTFHGRDIMGPVAAHLARGVALERLGSPSPVLQTLDLPPAVVDSTSALAAVIAVDSFGNLMTNLGPEVLPMTATQVTIQLDDQPPVVVPVAATYAERRPGSPVVLIGSSNRLEVAVVNGNAAVQLCAGLGATLRLQWQAGR